MSRHRPPRRIIPNSSTPISARVNHLAAWVEVVARRITEWRAILARRRRFPAVADTGDEAWAAALDNLDRQHRNLLDVVARLDAAKLLEVVPGKDYAVAVMLHGTAQHYSYHAGQIALLKEAGGGDGDPRAGEQSAKSNPRRLGGRPESGGSQAPEMAKTGTWKIDRGPWPGIHLHGISQASPLKGLAPLFPPSDWLTLVGSRPSATPAEPAAARSKPGGSKQRVSQGQDDSSGEPSEPRFGSRWRWVAPGGRAAR